MPSGACVELDAGPLVPIGKARPHAQDGPVTLVIRPEHLRIEHAGDKGIPATLQMAIPHGPLTIFDLSLQSGDRVKAVATGSGTRHVGGSRRPRSSGAHARCPRQRISAVVR